MIDWGKMWGSCNDQALRVIRVKTEYVGGNPVSIANAFNKSLWIRRPLSSAVEPGVYSIGYDGGLVRKTDYTEDYPDLELKMPNFQDIEVIKDFSLEELEEIRFGLQKMKEADSSVVCIDRDGMYSSDIDWKTDDDFSPPAVAIEKKWFSKLPIEKDKSIRIARQNFELAIDEMMFYQGTREVVLIRPKYKLLPLIFGVSPEACAILTERRYSI